MLDGAGAALDTTAPELYVARNDSVRAPRGKNRARVRFTVFAADAVDVVDGSTNAVVRRIQVGSRPHGVLYDPDADRVYVTNRGGCNSTPGSVSVVDAKKGIVEATVPVGTCPRFLDRDRETGLVYVPNAFTSRSVSLIRTDG